MAAPGGNEGGVAAGAAARHQDVDVLGPLTPMHPLRLVARLDGAGQLAPALEIGAHASRPGVEIFLETRPGPAVPRQDLHVLRWQDHEGLPGAEATQARPAVP